MKDNVIQIKDGEQYITLNVLLKISGIISTGGQAKYYLQENDVLVNNELESRRGRKLYPGDEIVVEGKKFIVK